MWDDVGLNIPKPPELLYLFRESMKNNHFSNTEYQSISTQTDGDIEEVELLVSIVYRSEIIRISLPARAPII